ncbi:MAG: hypothetical protein AAFV25_26215 [Bacteroidota bacterium]
MNESEKIKKIEAYLQGDLPEDEKRAFELLIQSDVQWTEAWEKYQIGREAVRQLSEEHWRSRFQEWREEGQQEETAEPQNNVRKVASKQPNPKQYSFSLGKRIAAILLLLLVAGAGYLLTRSLEHSSSKVATIEYLDEEFRNVQNAHLAPALKSYEEGKYQQALEQLSTLPNPNDVTYLFMGQLHFQLSQYTAAADVYRRVYQMEDSSYREEAEWNLLVTLLQQNENDQEARDLLRNIKNNDKHSYYTEAGQLIQQLEKNDR